MKKIIIFLFAVLMVTICFAQETKDVTKFMGIPVDGTKSEMIQKLKSKGFTYNTKTDFLEGEFNGNNVFLEIKTDNKKVSYITVVMGSTIGYDEILVKTAFNNLSQQFERNPKYVIYKSDLIDEDEDISYEMLVNSKLYKNIYLQNGDVMKPVLVGIMSYEFKYYILIVYCNQYNAADGEDL